MAVCKFWLNGTCKFGERCKFEHPPRDGGRNNNNRFAALQTPESSPGYNQGRNSSNSYNQGYQASNGFQSGRSGNQSGQGRGQSAPSVYTLSHDGIRADLTTELPQWILSAYGPGIKAPAQLFGGADREQSFEEIRMRHYEARAMGNPALAIGYEDELVQKARAQNQNALSDIDGAVEYIRRAQDDHPNRIDICANPSMAQNSIQPATGASNPPPSNPLVPTANSAFGQPSMPGHKPNPFGAPSQPTGNGAGNAPFSSFGGSTAPFGVQPAASNAFAPASNPFGGPSPFAPVSQPTVAQPASKNPFALTTGGNPFGSSPAPFGAPSAPNAFSQPPQAANLFSGPAPVANPFSGPAPVANGFPTNPTPFGNTPASNPFGGPPQQNAPPTQSTSNPFGTPASNVFARPDPTPSQQNPLSTGNNPFQQATPATSGSNVFAPKTNSNPISTFQAPNGIGQSNTGQPSPYAPDASFQHPPLQSYAVLDNRGALSSFKGRPVIYKDGQPGFQYQAAGKPGEPLKTRWERIWFPKGPPQYNKDTEMPSTEYDEATMAAYLQMRESGTFLGGEMPLLPPKREWTTWDF